MRKRFCLLPALALALLCACSKGAAKTPPTRPADFTSTERQFNTPADGDTIAIFDTSLGEVRAVLYPDAAPMAVYNFVGLARSGYYDNTTIWRSEYGFAVQGGDATGTGTRRFDDLEQQPVSAGGERGSEALRRGALRRVCRGRRRDRRQQSVLLCDGPAGQREQQ